MPPQPVDMPDDTAALEQELAGLRESQAQHNRSGKIWVIVLIICFVVGFAILRSIDDLEIMRTFATWMIVLVYIMSLPATAIIWRKAYIKRRIKCIHLLLHNTTDQRDKLIQIQGTLLKLDRAFTIFTILVNTNTVAGWLVSNFGDYHTAVSLAITVMILLAAIILIIPAVYLEKQVKRIEATAEWRAREKQQSRAKEQ